MGWTFCDIYQGNSEWLILPCLAVLSTFLSGGNLNISETVKSKRLLFLSMPLPGSYISLIVPILCLAL